MDRYSSTLLNTRPRRCAIFDIAAEDLAAELGRGQVVALADAVPSSEQSDRPTGIWLNEVPDRIQALTGPILDDDCTAVVLEARPEEARP